MAGLLDQMRSSSDRRRRDARVPTSASMILNCQPQWPVIAMSPSGDNYLMEDCF